MEESMIQKQRKEFTKSNIYKEKEELETDLFSIFAYPIRRISYIKVRHYEFSSFL